MDLTLDDVVLITQAMLEELLVLFEETFLDKEGEEDEKRDAKVATKSGSGRKEHVFRLRRQATSYS